MPSYLRFLIFFLVLSLALGGINLFVHRRLTAAFDLSPRARKILAGVLLLGFVSMIAGRVWRMGDHGAEILGVLGSTIQLAAIVTFAALVLERLANLMVGLVHKLRKPSEPLEEDSQEEAPGLGRRDFLTKAATGTAAGLGVVSAGYAGLFGRHDYVVEEVPIKLERLPPSLDGFTIVQLSDLHLGTFVGDGEVRSALELVRRAEPDLIVLTGDLLDHDPRYADKLGSMVRQLSEQARVVGIPGNHDHYAGMPKIMRTIEQAGGEVLINRGMQIGDRGGRFALLGVDDVWGRRFGRKAGPDLDRALKDVPPDLARVLLCHNPAFFPEAASDVDLQLSGHTHGGQFNPGVRPADLVLPFGYVAGHYLRQRESTAREAEAQLYVNRGFGTAGPPARLGAAPEVTRIILTS